MPIKKAAFKALRQSKKRAARNAQVKNEIKKLIKASRKAIAEKNVEKAKEFVKRAISALDRAQVRGILKRNTVARKKSRLMAKLNALLLQK
jgi:small subunit ribosomal protein S20